MNKKGFFFNLYLLNFHLCIVGFLNLFYFLKQFLNFFYNFFKQLSFKRNFEISTSEQHIARYAYHIM